MACHTALATPSTASRQHRQKWYIGYFRIPKDQLRVLDQAAYRFTKLQDSMGQKVLPAILDLAQEPISSEATFAEKLNWLERMGVLPSAEAWKKLRVAGNAIAHEYPDDPEMRASTINQFLDGAAQLNALCVFVGGYLLKHFPNVGRTSQ